MATAGMNSTAALTGMLPSLVLVAALLSLPVCLLLLRLYRRAVLRGMGILAGTAAATPLPAARAAPGAALQIVEVEPAAAPAPTGTAAQALQRGVRGPWRAALVYAGAGLVYALLMTAGSQAADRQQRSGALAQWAFLLWTYLWPGVLAVLLVAAYDARRRLQVLGAYGLVLAAICTFAVSHNPSLRGFALPLAWLIYNGPPSVLLATFLLRPIRAVGPLVLVFMLMLALGSQLLITLADTNDAVLRSFAATGAQVGLGAHGVFLAIIGVGMLVFGVLGWPLLRWLGRRYQAKKFSDQSIIVDALFMMFAFVQAIGFAFIHPWWMLIGPVAFVGYKTAALFGFGLPGGAGAPHTLLLLRVYRLGKRSERLFDKLRRHWQPVGSIRMIAGPDLVTSTVEPHEFLEFLSGRLARSFVTGGADLERRIAALDAAADPDGRYRINAFFCRTDTWQMTMQRLAATSDVVLMDLRSFAPANQGCLFELGQLLDIVALARLLLLVDTSTDRLFLEATLQQLWSRLSAGSPNRGLAAPRLRLFRIGAQSEPVLRALLAHLLARPGEVA